ncbi:MAG: response regulator [Saprospiraceae bacterium]|nr:response regulator [Saprospiraceae bacterium]
MVLAIACRVSCTYQVSEAQPLLHLDVKDGLTSAEITCIFQDRKGFLYFGSNGLGLNRYDGKDIKNWIPRIDLPKLAYPHYGWTMVEDELGYIWIGGGTGLYCYDPRQDTFSVFQPEEPRGLKTCITGICLDQSGQLWVGGGDLGLLKFDPSSGKFFTSEEVLGRKTKMPLITEIMEDSHGDLWFSGPNGLYQFNEEVGVRYHPLREDNSREANDWYVYALCEDDLGNIWAGTKNELLTYDRSGDTLQTVSVPFIESGVSNIAKGPKGMLWMTTFDESKGDLVNFNPLTYEISSVSHEMGLANAVQNLVWSLSFDRSEGLWMGTNKGLYYGNIHQKPFNTHRTDHDNSSILLFDEKYGTIWNAAKGKLQTFRFSGQEHKPLIESANFTVAQDQQGNIWKGSWNGLSCYKQNEGVWRTGSEQPMKWKGLAGKAATHVYADNDGILWVGVHLDQLYHYDEDGDTFKPLPLVFPGSADTLKKFNANVFEDNLGFQWVSTRYGLFKLNDKQTMAFIPDIPLVHDSHVDGNGMLWLATGGGLYLLNPKSHETRHWLHKDGLPHDMLYSLLADDKGNLWLGTQNGLSRFNIESESCRNFDSSDGIPGDEFQPGALKNPNGEFFFITNEGLLHFHPDSIGDNPYAPRIVITDFKIKNRSMPILGSLGDTLPATSPLVRSVSYSDEINLDWNQRDISFEFAALNYLQPEKNRYAYRMLPYDDGWNYTDAERPYASYTNLNSGQYTFEILGSNNDGKWSEKAVQLLLTISPPWFKTWWAYTFYGLTILSVLWLLRRFETERQRLRHQLELENVRAEKLQEVNQIKSRFFANISHEFRTPLTLMLGPITDLINKANRRDLKDLDLLQRNNHRLLNLINQLLDLSKIEAREMGLQASPQDFAPLLRQVLSAFSSVGKEKEIRSIYHSSVESIYLYFERDKIEKVLLNILSNAYKFTPEGGQIRVDLNVTSQEEINKHMASDGWQTLPKVVSEHSVLSDPDGRSAVLTKEAGIHAVPHLILTVSNSGPGIKEEFLPHIFDRFYQIDGDDQHSHEGTGIGLSLARELVLLHQGTIRVDSEIGTGTSFTIELPLGKDHLSPEEIVEKEDGPDLDLTMIGSLIQTQPISASVDVDSTYPLLLIVEDNTDMRAYIRAHLQADYRLIEVTNGQEGLDIARKEVPDLVLSDVMMPIMDGLELCNRLKADHRTSHIPIILLTAKAEVESRIEGLEIGADAYLAKPFDRKELAVRIKKLLDLRKTLHARYSGIESITGLADSGNQREDDFIRDLQLLIQENLDDPDFGIHQICRSMQMSRAQVYRKVKALTNISVRLYIRKFRLRKAYELLRTSTRNISEIAYDVGFRDPAYFSRIFSKEFGLNPSALQNQDTIRKNL